MLKYFPLERLLRLNVSTLIPIKLSAGNWYFVAFIISIVKNYFQKDTNDDIIEVVENPPINIQPNILINQECINSKSQPSVSTSVTETNSTGVNFASKSSIYLIPSPIEDSSLNSVSPSTNSTSLSTDMISKSSIYLIPSPIENSPSNSVSPSTNTNSSIYLIPSPLEDSSSGLIFLYLQRLSYCLFDKPNLFF